jgi:SAM-dependent methyltransferase
MTERFSFEVVDAVDYEELRPGYAPEAVSWALDVGGLEPASKVIDLAAGTGQLSRLLLGRGCDVVAVEPASNMRAILEERLPSVRSVDATAEALPFDDGSVDGVMVGNAFHHFDREAAFAELRRVLRPRGALALFWAWPLEEEQRAIPGIDEIYEVVERFRAASAIIAAYRAWAEPPETETGFERFTRREFPHLHVLPAARLADLYATSSDVASLPEKTRAEMLGRIRDIARGLAETLELPSRTVVDLTRRTD